MEYKFEAEQWEDLTPERKAGRCRFMAREMARLASGATPDFVLAYKKIAEAWLELADDIERPAKSAKPEPVLYRCYILDNSDRIKSFEEVQAATDEEAIVQAGRSAKLASGSFELWRGRKLVCPDLKDVKPKSLPSPSTGRAPAARCSAAVRKLRNDQVRTIIVMPLGAESVGQRLRNINRYDAKTNTFLIRGRHMRDRITRD